MPTAVLAHCFSGRECRRRLGRNKWSAETCCAIKSLTATQFSLAWFAAIICDRRGHRRPSALGSRYCLRREPLPRPESLAILASMASVRNLAGTISIAAEATTPTTQPRSPDDHAPL
jgi:hypothetical protein